MYNRGECYKNNDRFISQFHNNLVKVTFDHFKRQKDTFKKRVDEQKDQNQVIRQKIQTSQEEYKTLRKELEKYQHLSTGRNVDYEKIKVAIENELEDVKSKVQELILRGELKESKTRELEVETNNENNKLSSESQKLGIIEDQLQIVNIKSKSLEEDIKKGKILIQKFEQDLEHQKKNLTTMTSQQKQIQKKYDVSKDFVENINIINDEFIHSMELLNREKRSMYFSKALHEKFNSRLVNIIIMNNISHETTNLRSMMSKLDVLNNDLAVVSVKTDSITCFQESVCSSLRLKPPSPKKKSKKRQNNRSCATTKVESLKGVQVLRIKTPGGGDNSDDICKCECSIREVNPVRDGIQLLYRNMNNIETNSD